MSVLVLKLFLYSIFLPFCTSFLTAPVSTILNYPRRNLTCSSQTDEIFLALTNEYNGANIKECNYCLISIITVLVNNSIKTVTYRDGLTYMNAYRNLAINYCNFSRTMDIGYGSCFPYPFEPILSQNLCICSTNNCTATYITCQTSVNQSLSSPPPLLPVIAPTLTNIITCQDSYVNYSVQANISPPMYLGCFYMLFAMETFDLSQCYIYTPNHSVICAIVYDSVEGMLEQIALVEGTYELWINSTITAGALLMNSSSYVYYQGQTSTNIVTIQTGISNRSYISVCLCTTNNCNIDLETCTNGLNIPSYFLPYNRSTTNISQSTTVSSNSTTRLTSSSSSNSISTTFSSSTVALGTTSNIGIGMNATMTTKKPSNSANRNTFMHICAVGIWLTLYFLNI